MALMLIPRVMDEMNDDDDEDPSKDVEPRTKQPKLSDEEDVEPRTKQPKLSDEEEMAPASSGGGLSCAAVTQAETTDPESSATFSVSAYEDDLRFFERLHANDDSVELFHQQEAIRRLNFAKKLCTMYSVNFYRYWEDLLKEFEMEGVIAPNDWGAKQCLIVRCDKFFAVNRNVAYYKLLESLVDFAPYMQENEVDEGGLEWLKEKGHLTTLCNYFIDEKEIRFALRELNALCYHMEWRYHPLITKGHRDDFLTIIKRRAGAKRQKVKQTYEDYSFVMSFWADFINNLVDKCKETSPSYQHVAEQVALHDEFDSYLDSCESIEHDSSINELLGDEMVVTRQFSLLDKELVKESLNAKIYMLKKVHEVESYFTCLESLVRQRLAGTYDFDILLKQLTNEGLFKFSNLPTDKPSNLPTDKPIRENWSSKFYELLDKARHAAFAHFPEHYVVIGLLDYSFIFSINGEHHESQSVEERLAAVRYHCNLKTYCLTEGLWVTKHYAHPIYEQFGDALKLIDLPPTI